MSWFLTAGHIVKNLAGWKDLCKEGKWFARKYLLELASAREAHMETQQAIYAILTMKRLLEKPGLRGARKKIFWCWGCGDVEITKGTLDPNLDWLEHGGHETGSWLCPKCQDNEHLLFHFINDYETRALSLLSDIAKFGTYLLPEFKGLEPGWANDMKEEAFKAEEKVMCWIGEILGNFSQYSLPPEKLQDG